MMSSGMRWAVMQLLIYIQHWPIKYNLMWRRKRQQKNYAILLIIVRCRVFVQQDFLKKKTLHLSNDGTYISGRLYQHLEDFIFASRNIWS